MKKLMLIILFCFVSCNVDSNIEEKIVKTPSPWLLRWKKVAQKLLINSDTLEVKNIHTMATFAHTNAIINGWDHPRTIKFLNQTYDAIEKNSYGLEYAWDAFQDGTINPKSTNYTITIATHVGSAFLEGFKKGKIEKSKIDNLYNALKKVPQIDDLKEGICFAYSDSDYDRVQCVHNVNIATAVFYNELNKLKFNDLSFDKIIDDIIIRENNSYLPKENNFLYSDGGSRRTDQNHLAFQAWCMMQLPNKKSNVIGKEVIDEMSFNREKTIKSLIGHLRILEYNEYNKDSLLIDLENITNNTDTIYKSGGYEFSNPRINAQIALGAALYYNFKLNN